MDSEDRSVGVVVGSLAVLDIQLLDGLHKQEISFSLKLKEQRKYNVMKYQGVIFALVSDLLV